MRFNNDYNCGAHPEIIKALENTNNESYCGYGLDEWCLKASDEIKKYLGNANADIHFLVGGTQTNFTVIAAALRPFQGVISADSGHINVHETGAVENTGHKVHVLKSENGKITAEQIAKEAEFFNTSDVKEHITQPKMVYISFPTEYGTIYTKQELEEISKTCKKYKLYLFIDGARLGYGLGSKGCDITMKDLAELTDVFYIGGTKCGAFFGEAVVITNDELKENFRSYIKQNGGLLAKGWLLGIQFYTLFKDGLYFDITKKADELALEIKNAFESKGIPSYIESFTNQQFVILPNDAMEKLKKYIYEFEMKIDENHSCVRFCTSWSSKKEDVSELVKDIKLL
jgi:threonine aldolase